MLAHWVELRRRLLSLVWLFAGLFLFFFYCSNALFQWVVWPLHRTFPNGHSLIATQVTTALMTPLTLAMDAALICSAPFFLWQVWKFIAPALYPTERRGIATILICSPLLFVIGGMFCFFLVLPWLLQFFIRALPHGVSLMPDMGYMADFILHMVLIFGLCFQVPLICMALAQFGWISRETMQAFRPYVIVAAFIIGMILTPPDVLSQITLALPLCLLYEFGLVLAGYVEKKP